MAPPRSQPSSAFASRELNGEVLLDELNELRQGQVPQRPLDECARALQKLNGPTSQCAATVRHLASSRFAGYPALVSLLRRWATRLKTEADGPLLAAHFERLAISAAVINSLRGASEGLPRSRR